MEIKILEISGIISCLEALRLPYGLECRSKVNHTDGLINAKDFNCDPSIYDYVFLSAERIDINKQDVSLLQALVKRGPEHAKCIRGINVYAKITAPIYFWCEMEQYNIGRYRLASESTMHIDCKGLKEDELVKAKSEIPMGKELTKVDVFNYQNLRNIYFQRKDHRLPEWREFCECIEELPFAKEFITCK